jgi:aryl-alcohol dehydrogenase-like predicted oxidoreductase
MILRTLGQSDLGIIPIGIGAWAIGGGKWDTKGMNESAN